MRTFRTLAIAGLVAAGGALFAQAPAFAAVPAAPSFAAVSAKPVCTVKESHVENGTMYYTVFCTGS